MPRAYISARVKDELRIRQLRDQLWSITKAHKFYKKKIPHVTVIPPFTVKSGCEERVESLVEDTELKGREVKVNSVSVYQNIHNPYVVLLDVDVNIQDVRNELLTELPEYADGRIVEPSNPHITLFKTQGWWEDVDKDVKDKLQQEIMHRKMLADTSISHVEIDFKT